MHIDEQWKSYSKDLEKDAKLSLSELELMVSKPDRNVILKNISTKEELFMTNEEIRFRCIATAFDILEYSRPSVEEVLEKAKKILDWLYKD